MCWVSGKYLFFLCGKDEGLLLRISKWRIIPNSKNLNKLEANLEEISKNVEQASRAFPHLFKENMSCENIKMSVKKAKELILLEREFASIIDKELDLDESNFTWTKVKEIWEEAKQKASISRPEKWLSEAAEAAKWNIYGKIIEGAWWFIEEINKGGDKLPPNAYPSNAEELNFLQEVADEVPKMIYWLEKEHGEIKNKEAKIQEMKAKNEQLKSFIQQERKKHGYSFQPTHQPNPQEEKKIQDQQREIDYLKKQLTELQIQIEELKQNQNNSTDSQVASQIESLQEKKQQIQSKLEKKQSQQKELKNKVNSQQSNSQQTNNADKFNWLYVVIPGAALLIVMGIIIAYLVGKRSKNN